MPIEHIQSSPRWSSLISSRAYGDEPALLCASGRRVSYGELRQRAAMFGEALRALPRGLILCLVPRTLSAVAAYVARIDSPHVVLPVDGDSAEEVDAVIRRLEPDFVVGPPLGLARCNASLLGTYRVLDSPLPATQCLHRRAREAPARVPGNALKLVLRTSGSLGEPKWVRLSGRAVLANADAVAEVMELSAADRGITSLPLASAFGLSILHSHLRAGAAVLVSEAACTQRLFWDSARASSVSVLCTVPRPLQLLRAMQLDCTEELPTLRLLCQAGGPIDDETTRHWWQHTGGRFAKMYGQTEATARITYLAPHDLPVHPASVGCALPGGSLRIAPAQERPGGPGQGAEPAAQESGEVIYAGPNVMLGYLRHRDDLYEASVAPAALHTGDIGHLEDGYLTLTGRLDRMVKIAGRRVQLEDIEAFLGRAGEVAASYDGQRLNIFAPDTEGAQRRRDELCRRLQIAPQELAFIQVPQLPLTRNGKIDHRALRS